MKKIITSALFVFFAATLFSCQKEALQESTIPATTSPTTITSLVKSISSDWLNLPFNEVWPSSTPRFVFQLAEHTINPAITYNPVTDEALAYVKIQGSNNNNYYRIPGVVSTSTQNLDMNFWMGPASFSISIYNADDHTLMPVATPFQNYRFRYIVISKTTYQSLNINWNNYYEVAAALNISL